MKIDLSDFGSMLREPELPPKPLPPDPVQKRSGREVASENELKVLKAIRFFGHLRLQELGRAVWPKHAYAEQMAARTLKRLELKEEVLRRKNSLASSSFVLSSKGARRLKSLGLPCRHGRDIVGVAGATFFHRTLASRFLIEEQITGKEVFGEYAIAHNLAPATREHLAKTFGKLPDGLVIYKCKTKTGNPILLADWLEVEQAAKPLDEIKKVVCIAQKCGSWLDAGQKVKLFRLVVLFDQSQNHGTRLLKAATEVWFGSDERSRDDIESRIILARADVIFPLQWRKYEFVTLKDFRAHHISKNN